MVDYKRGVDGPMRAARWLRMLSWVAGIGSVVLFFVIGTSEWYESGWVQEWLPERVRSFWPFAWVVLIDGLILSILFYVGAIFFGWCAALYMCISRAPAGDDQETL